MELGGEKENGIVYVLKPPWDATRFLATGD